MHYRDLATPLQGTELHLLVKDRIERLNPQNIEELTKAAKDFLDLRKEIVSKGMPPHSDYWSRSVEELSTRLAAAVCKVSAEDLVEVWVMSKDRHGFGWGEYMGITRERAKEYMLANANAADQTGYFLEMRAFQG